MPRESMVMYRSFYDSFSELPPDQYKHLMMSIASYSLDGIEPELTGMERALFILIRPQLDANETRYQNSLKGGKKKTSEKPNPNQTDTEAEPRANQDDTEIETNVNDNVSVNDNVNDTENENAYESAEDEPFSREEALNPNKQNIEQLFQQLKTAWNANCKPSCNIKNTITMNAKQRDDWRAGSSQIVNVFDTCKAIQNYGGICSSPEHKAFPDGYSMLGFLVSGVERYCDEAKPFETMRIKPASRIPEKVPSVEVPDAEKTRRMIEEIKNSGRDDGFVFDGKGAIDALRNRGS
ncbi:MAG: DUF6291 domain-containing protein [Patescibacteria group bacterium]